MLQLSRMLFFFLVLALSNCTYLFAQQTPQRQTGIYKTYQEFVDNKPSITKAFKVVKDTSIIFDEQREIMDTTIKKVKYLFVDGSKTISDIWGLCDSGQVFIKLHNSGLVVVEHLGKYPYMFFMKRAGFSIFSPMGIPFAIAAGITVASNIASINGKGDLTLAFIDEKGNCYEIDTPRMFKILRPQKDLHDAFWDEKKKNTAVYEKYLRLLNERYPVKP